MTGPLFDPSKMAVRREREQANAGPDAATLTVSTLAGLIDGAIRRGVPQRVRVLGEVCGFRERTHLYFDLKDASAAIGCVVFASAALRLRVRPEEGRQFVASGRLEFYAPQGRVSFIVDALEPVGEGPRDLAYRKLLEELRSAGYLDQGRKRTVPSFPRRIGVVTSRSAAALQDVLVTMRRRAPGVGVLLADVRVQGEGAAEEVARAVDRLSRNHQRLGIDVIIVTRGGGSKEDLWAFNERVVADAIFRSQVPVIAAIGHETDVTIAELVADERCATPTQAAMRATPDASALRRQVRSMGTRLAAAMSVHAGTAVHRSRDAGRRLERAVQGVRHAGQIGVERAASRLERQRPTAVVARLRARTDAGASRLRAAVIAIAREPDLRALGQRLRRSIGALVPAATRRVDSDERELRAVSPLAVLERGYSVTTGPNGRLVRSVHDVRPGDALETRVADGSVRSTVEGGPTHAPSPGPSRVRARPAQGPGLFGPGEA